jgi:hypothetical protein
MKYFLGIVFSLGFSASNAQALDFQCGKTIEFLPVPNAPTVSRPSLLVKVVEREDGTTFKQYKPLSAANEHVADFLLSIRSTVKVCIKYYDPMLPAPVPLTILDIFLDK